jgi:hypothetical protein
MDPKMGQLPLRPQAQPSAHLGFAHATGEWPSSVWVELERLK